jgi:hypothetical protein
MEVRAPNAIEDEQLDSLAQYLADAMEHWRKHRRLRGLDADVAINAHACCIARIITHCPDDEKRSAMTASLLYFLCAETKSDIGMMLDYVNLMSAQDKALLLHGVVGHG